jgi:hypothetical protein
MEASDIRVVIDAVCIDGALGSNRIWITYSDDTGFQASMKWNNSSLDFNKNCETDTQIKERVPEVK